MMNPFSKDETSCDAQNISYFDLYLVIFQNHMGFKPSDGSLSRRETGYSSLIHPQDSFRKGSANS